VVDLWQRLDELDLLDAPDMRADIERRAAELLMSSHEQLIVPDPVPSSRRGPLTAVATAAAILALVAAAALLIRAAPSDVTDTTEVPTSTTVATLRTPPDFSDGWAPVAVGEPWVQSIVDIDALPDGGFIVAATDPWRLMWSPDGTEWFDADPQHQLSDPMEWGFRGGPGEHAGPVVLAGGRALILSRATQGVTLGNLPLGVWVGDPREGTWELVSLDLSGLDYLPRLLTVGSSDSEAMVVAASPSGYELVAWLIDLASGTSQWHPLPAVPWEQRWPAGGGYRSDRSGDSAAVEWFNGRWLVAPSCRFCSTVYLSTDGATWTESEIRLAADAAPVHEFRPGDGWGTNWLDVATGPDAIVAAFFFGPHAYSEDGVTWLALSFPSGSDDWDDMWPAVTYSDELGFVTNSWSGRFMQMTDGPPWQEAGRWPVPEIDEEFNPSWHLAASGGRMLLLQMEDFEAGVMSLWLWDSS
jgi:hypothetical protein